jgi:hypothetical protein
MLEQKDIEQAKALFMGWDKNRKWYESSDSFREHTKKKAHDSLTLATYLLDKLEQTSELEDNGAATLWIIAQSYYSMFFEVEYLLSLDGKKLPPNARDTHKTMYLAFVYYYVIKGSEYEQKRVIGVSTSRMSKALALFKELQDEAMELQRVEKSVRDLKAQKEQRHAFTYRMSRSAEIAEAKRSVEKAIAFRELVEEYIVARSG